MEGLIDENVTIPEFFAGQNIFITGGTGFLGKVFIEKVLRSCPGVGKIYMLIRSKNGLTLKQRMEKMYEMGIFDILRKEMPNCFFEKVVPIVGDITELRLGLSDEDRQILIDNVTMVVHSAATVRFDQPLKEAIILNTRGTREVCELSLEMKKLLMVLHVSTAYCQTDKKVVEEQVYPAPADWQKAIRVAEELDSEFLQPISLIYHENYPNTYTFTKALAEAVVFDTLNGKVANIIVRPTIVISTRSDPFPGWVDNYNGPVGLFLACGTGLVRITLASNVIADYAPVDNLIRSFLISMWNKAKSPKEEFLTTTILNCSSHNLNDLSMSELVSMAATIVKEAPLSKSIWNISSKITSSTTVYYINVILFHLLPALFLDLLLKIFGYKPMILKIQRRIYAAVMALKYFMMNEWVFKNDNLLAVEEKLLNQDKKDFGFDLDNINPQGYFLSAILGAKKWLLKEDLNNIEKDRKHLQRLRYLDVAVSVTWYLLIFYILFIKCNIFNYFGGKIYNYMSEL